MAEPDPEQRKIKVDEFRKMVIELYVYSPEESATEFDSIHAELTEGVAELAEGVAKKPVSDAVSETPAVATVDETESPVKKSRSV